MNLRDIKLRIRSVRKTQQITRAMKMVAAVKFRHAQARLLNARPYAARIRELTARALVQLEAGLSLREDTEDPPPLLQPRPVHRLLLVVVASDKGLCGSFNGNIYRAVQRYLKEQSAGPVESRPDVGLMLVGRKINDLFKRFHPPNLSCAVHRYIPQAEADVATLGNELITLFTEGRYDRVDAFFTEFKSVIQNQVVHESLLPLSPVPAESGTTPTPDMLLEPALPDILADLLPRFLLTRVRQILMESEASEQGTRMSMMDQATKNADDLITQLMLEFNKARQWNITLELSDITTGAEAMS